MEHAGHELISVYNLHSPNHVQGYLTHKKTPTPLGVPHEGLVQEAKEYPRGDVRCWKRGTLVQGYLAHKKRNIRTIIGPSRHRARLL